MKRLIAIALAAVGASVQIAPPATAQAAVEDEIVVLGRNRRLLRIEIERVEDAVFERFNALNSDDDLDMRCSEEAPLGSNITRRRCVPRFAIEAETRVAYDVLLGLTGSPYAGIPDMHLARLRENGERLVKEMVRLAREDEQLRSELTRLIRLKEVEHGPRGRARPRRENER